MKENILIKKCQNGDMESFSLLYDTYVDKIYKYIYFKTSHRETAEDLTSKTFFKAMKKINSFSHGDSYFSAWLYTIARNTVADYYRAKKNDINIDDLWDISDNSYLVDEIDNKNKIKEIKGYLSTFKKEQREIIILRVWQEMSYKEISEILGKSEEACRMSFSRAIHRLREEAPLILFLLINLKL